MANCSPVPMALLCVIAMSACVLILDVTGVVSLDRSPSAAVETKVEVTGHGYLRGDRRLQQYGGYAPQAQGSPYPYSGGYGGQASSSMQDAIENSSKLLFIVAQLIFACIYYQTVVARYPFWQGPTPYSAQIQSMAAPCAAMNASPSNMCLSFFCPQARAAHTFDKTGTIDYWCGLMGMLFCPFCTLCWANACTDLNAKLGGQPANPLASLACTWLCSCCVIAQDAESLDAATGVRTECCGVSGGGGFPVPYGMQQQMMPGQMMMMGPPMY